MLRRSVWPFLVGSLLLAGCVNYEKQEEAFDASMIGLPEAQVIQRMGVPQQTYEANGHKFLAYNHESQSYISDGGFGGSMGMGGFGGGMMGMGPYDFGEPSFDSGETDVMSCQTVFDLLNGVVQNFARHGDGC